MDAEFVITRKSAKAVSSTDIGACYSLVENIRPFYEASPEGWSRRVKLNELKYTPNLEYLLVKRNRKLAAFVSFVLNDDFVSDMKEDALCLYIWEIHVDPQYYRQNLGHTLMGELTTIAQDTNQAKIMLRCFQANSKAMAFYKKEGFSDIPELADEFCVIYEKNVQHLL